MIPTKLLHFLKFYDLMLKLRWQLLRTLISDLQKRMKSIKLNIQRHSFIIQAFRKTWEEKPLKIEGKSFLVCSCQSVKVSNYKLCLLICETCFLVCFQKIFDTFSESNYLLFEYFILFFFEISSMR